MSAVFDEPLYPFDGQPADGESKAVAVVGAGPVGLCCAIDLAQQGVDVVVLDDNDRVSSGSRAICFAQRTLEIFERLGCGQRMLDRGVTWQRGRVYSGEREIYSFDLQPDGGHRFPAFINLQQYYVEQYLVERLRELQHEGAPVELRGRSRVTDVTTAPERVSLAVETPEGRYQLHAKYAIACDGANSAVRQMMRLDFDGRVFEDNFLIADVKMRAGFPTERWFWFDPPFNRGQSALLHKQPDDVWRIDLQLGPGADKETEKLPDNVIPRIRSMLGDDVDFELEWVSVYTFQCRRMKHFRHGRLFFAGDAAHQVSPFGARGANGGIQDADNLCWKLGTVLRGDASEASEALLDSYDTERIAAADENILNSTRSTDFLTPKTEASRTFRDAVLALSTHAPFARPLVNSGRLSRPATYDVGGGADEDDGLPPVTRPGAPAADAPLGDGWLLDHLGGRFTLLTVGPQAQIGEPIEALPATLHQLRLRGDEPCSKARYLGDAQSAAYLIRPDQHVAARWVTATASQVLEALTRCTAGSSTEGRLPAPRSTPESEPRDATPRLDDPDDFYEALLAEHEGLSEAQSAALNARLVLVLASHVGESSVLRSALTLARERPPQHHQVDSSSRNVATNAVDTTGRE